MDTNTMSVRTLRKKHVEYSDLLKDKEDPFSTNRVTGWSLNFPIIGTCVPTVVCADTCYFAKGPSTWTASLKKQHRLMNAVKMSPVGMARKIATHARKKKLSYIRWNGGGDLFDESVECINQTAELLNDVQHWVVTRIPKLAIKLIPRDNVWVHLSVDKSSWARLEEFKKTKPDRLINWFWSYQCDSGEVPPSEEVAPIIFRDKYDLQGNPSFATDCTLNVLDDISGACSDCRRCFNGSAKEKAKDLLYR